MAGPATQRPRLPGVGRLGLVEPTAAADLATLGWDTDNHVELLWSLSRAPDADAALQTMVRLAEEAGHDEPPQSTVARVQPEEGREVEIAT